MAPRRRHGAAPRWRTTRPWLCATVLAGAGVVLAEPAPPAAASASSAPWPYAARAQGDALAVVERASGRVVRTQPVATLDGRTTGRVRQVVDVAARRSALVVLDGVPELWEVALDPQAPPLHDGYVHDWRMTEAVPSSAFGRPRRVPWPPDLPPLQALAPVTAGAWAIGVLAVDGEPSGAVAACPTRLVLLNLDVRRVVARRALRVAVDLARARVVATSTADAASTAFELPAPDGDAAVPVRVTLAPRAGEVDAALQCAPTAR